MGKCSSYETSRTSEVFSRPPEKVRSLLHHREIRISLIESMCLAAEGREPPAIYNPLLFATLQRSAALWTIKASAVRHEPISKFGAVASSRNAWPGKVSQHDMPRKSSPGIDAAANAVARQGGVDRQSPVA